MVLVVCAIPFLLALVVVLAVVGNAEWDEHHEAWMVDLTEAGTSGSTEGADRG